MNLPEDRSNWLVVSEIIRSIKDPVELYTSHFIETWHATLCGLLPQQCFNPGDCENKKKNILCPSCKEWYDKLAESHMRNEKGEFKSMWRQNCDTSKWPNEPWEVAKFFMPSLGERKSTVIDAESTDLSCLLNVLAWMENDVFPSGRRVDRNLVIKLRSEVRNPWAHAPFHKLTEDIRNHSFDIANKFLADLSKVFDRNEVKECIEFIKALQANGITIVNEIELKLLNLLRFEVGVDVSQVRQETKTLKEELKRLKDDQSSDREVIKKLEEELGNLGVKYKSLQDIVKSLQDTIRLFQDAVNIQGTGGRFQLKSCIPDKPKIFIGRDAEVEEIISSLVENDCGIVCIVGAAGFGKSTLAVEVSHNLRSSHGLVVIFSNMRSASTLPDAILHLCRDAGVISVADPESSLMFWVRSINEKRVVIVMDNIEHLLQSNVKREFTEFLFTLRKNSQQYLQILATTRTEFTIPGQQTIANYRIKEFDESFSVQLLRKLCPSDAIQDKYLSEVADLCGFIPLALSLAGKRIPGLEDPLKLTKGLRKKPMETLEPVQQAFEFSFQMLNGEEQKALVCLSVFVGSFRMKSAKKVIGKSTLETQDYLENFVGRSFIESIGEKRFMIHSLIRRFLADNVQFQIEIAMAQECMVSHFLKMCHSLTMECYSHNGFTSARESLKKDIHNVEKTLKICTQDEATNPNILQLLTSSDVYNDSARLFYNFSWDLLPVMVLTNFFETCMKLAESQNQPSIKILFQCLLADQEGRKSAWKSKQYCDRMEDIEEAFRKNKAALREDRALFMFSYHSLARYDFNKATSAPTTDLPEDDLQPLPDYKEASTIEKVAEAHILMEQGNIKKKRANKVFKADKKKYNEYMKSAKGFYNEALSLSKDVLGEHELTCILNKVLGDLFLDLRDNKEALRYYCDAASLRKTLKLDSNEPFVFLLKNCGTCLSYLCRYDESVKKLEEARDIADKLTVKSTPCRALVYYQLALAFCHWKPGCQEAAKYAKTAIEMVEFLNPRNIEALKEIVEKAEENMK